MKACLVLFLAWQCLPLPAAAAEDAGTAATSPLRWQNLKRPSVTPPVPVTPLPLPQPPPLPRTVEDYLRGMDADGDGRVSLPEYLAWMGQAFTRMDVDGNGVLEAAELPGGKGPAVTREQHRARMHERFHWQDADGDGYLDARELAAPPR